jgi:hypothetical protein
MKFLTTLVVVCLLFIPLIASAQSDTPQNFYAAGISYSQGETPSVSGTALYARKVADTGTYAFTVVDAIPTSTKPLTFNTNFSVGVAQKALTIGKVDFFIPTAAGVAFNGQNTGWAWSTGALATIPVKGQFNLCPSVRLVKQSISNGAGYQPIFGVLFGWGE